MLKNVWQSTDVLQISLPDAKFCLPFRRMTVFELTAHLQEVFLTQPVEEWEEEINDLDVPTIYEGVCAFFTSGLSLVLEPTQLEIFATAFLNWAG